MTVLKIDWTEENLKKYILFTSFLGNKMTRALIIGFLVSFVMIIGTCAAMYFMLDMAVFLLMAGVMTVFCAAAVLYFFHVIKRNVRSALESSAGDETDGLMITEEKILVCKNKEPVGEIGWDKITSITFNDKDGAAYLVSGGGAVLILEYKNIEAGTEKELRELLQIKNVKLPKEA